MTDDRNDEIFNDETTRALREWGRRFYAIGAGLLAGIVMLIPIVVTAARSVGLLFHLTVTFAVSLSLPGVAAYVTVRVYGLSHHETICAARQAAREAAAATTTLGAHQRAEQSPESIDTDATSPFADTDTDDTQ